MLYQNDDPIRFDELFDKEYLDAIYKRFDELVESYNIGDDCFDEVLANEFFCGNDYDNLVKRCKNLDINPSNETLIPFLVSNYFCFYYAVKAVNNDEFTKRQKLFSSGFLMFSGNAGTEDYPFVNPMEQVDEYLTEGNISEAFINTTFEWNKTSIIKQYNEQMSAKTFNL